MELYTIPMSRLPRYCDNNGSYHSIVILEALLKWEDKLIGYRIHVVTDHQALEFFKTQDRLSS